MFCITLSIFSFRLWQRTTTSSCSSRWRLRQAQPKVVLLCVNLPFLSLTGGHAEYDYRISGKLARWVSRGHYSWHSCVRLLPIDGTGRFLMDKKWLGCDSIRWRNYLEETYTTTKHSIGLVCVFAFAFSSQGTAVVSANTIWNGTSFFVACQTSGGMRMCVSAVCGWPPSFIHQRQNRVLRRSKIMIAVGLHWVNEPSHDHRFDQKQIRVLRQCNRKAVSISITCLLVHPNNRLLQQPCASICKVSFVCGRSCSPLAYALNYRIPRGYISLWFLKFSRFCIKSRGLCCVHAHIESDLGTSPVDMCVKYLSVLTTHFKMVRAGWVNVNFYKGCITRHMFSLQMSPPPC